MCASLLNKNKSIFYSMRKVLIRIGIAIAILGMVGVFFFKGSILPSVTTVADDEYFHIYKTNNVDNVADSLIKYGFIKSKKDLISTAGLMRFKDSDLVPGRFKLKKGWNNIQLLDFLARGKQSPVKLGINPMRRTENVATFLGKN